MSSKKSMTITAASPSPAATLKKGESFTDAIIREVFEETGLTISSPVLCGIKDWTNEDGSRYMVLCYKTSRFTGQLASSDEGEVSWLTLEQMKHARLAEGMETMLDLFLHDDLSEYFFYQEDGRWNEVLK